MNFDLKDVRTDYYRDGSVRWHGHGRLIHGPSGQVEEFVISWNDQSDRKRAEEALRQRVTAVE